MSSSKEGISSAGRASSKAPPKSSSSEGISSADFSETFPPSLELSAGMSNSKLPSKSSRLGSLGFVFELSLLDDEDVGLFPSEASKSLSSSLRPSSAAGISSASSISGISSISESKSLISLRSFSCKDSSSTSLSLSSSGASKPAPDKSASSPISATEISSGSSSTISSSSSTGASSNIERSGISEDEPEPPSSEIAIGFNKSLKSGASKVGLGSVESFEDVDAGFARPAKSERSSSTGELSTSASISGIPRTKSSASFLSSTSFGM